MLVTWTQVNSPASRDWVRRRVRLARIRSFSHRVAAGRKIGAKKLQRGAGAVEFWILGPLEVRDEGSALALGGAKQRALLASLLLHANRVVSTDRLIDALWGNDQPATARSALRVHVAQLRKALGEGRLHTRFAARAGLGTR